MNVNDIRTKIKLQRQNLNLSEVESLSAAVFNNFLKLDFILEKQNFFIYNAIKNEVDTSLIISQLKGLNKTIAYPVTIGSEMVAGINNSDNFSLGNFNVLEPSSYTIMKKVDVAIIPLVACDENKNRIGYGKGYYDKFLKDNDIVKIGLCYDFQITSTITPNEWDVPLDYIVTPTRIIY